MGEKVRVTVKLRGTSPVKGYISRAGGDNFVVTDKKSGVDTTIAYGEVVSVNRQRSTAAKIAIGVGIGAAAFGALMAALYYSGQFGG